MNPISPIRRGRRLVVLTTMLGLMAVAAFAQVQTGNIFGRVVDGGGNPLPGVTVTLTGVGAPQVFVTDAEGRFRFLTLSPGTYRLEAELAGFGTAARSSVAVNIGRNSEVSLTLTPAMAETITVTAATPLLDVRNAGTGATVTEIELEQVPTARDPWVILQQVPGVLVDRINVGGNESGQQSNYVGKGAGADQGTWNIDGVNITDMGATGSSPTYYDFDMFEEMQATTGGADPRIQTPGVQMNMVVKRGTNDFSGSGRYFLTDNSFQEEATVPAEAQSYLVRANEIDNITDWGAEMGGPIVRDRLWLWGSYGDQQIDLLTAARPGAGASFDKTTLENWNAKVNAQVLANNSLVGLFTHGDKIKLGRSVGPGRPPETGWNQSGPTDLWKIEDTHVFSSRFYLTGLYSQVEGGFGLAPAGGLDRDAWRGPDRGWNVSFIDYITDRPQEQARVDASTFFDLGTTSHELRFGFGYRDTPVTSATTWPGSGNWAWLFDETEGLAFLQNPVAPRDYSLEYTDFYVGDTILLGNLTIQAGLRYDAQKGGNRPSTAPANELFPDLLPAIAFGGDPQELEWTDVSPRVGVTYAFGDVKRTLLRAGYNRYVDQLGSGPITLGSPFYGNPGYIYYFEDLNGDKTIQPNEVLFDLGPIASFYLDPDNPGSSVVTSRIDYDMTAPTTDEFILGLEHELRPDFTVGLNYSHRNLKNFVWTRYEKTQGSGNFYTPADFVARTDTGTLPDGTPYQITYYDIGTGVPVPTFLVVENRDGYEQEYDGLELLLTKRMSNRWMARANVSWNDWKQSVDDEGIADPTRFFSRGSVPQVFQTGGCNNCDGVAAFPVGGVSGLKSEILINSRWSYSLTGVYQLPMDFSIGAALTGREGYPIPYNHAVTPEREGVVKNVLIGDIGDYRYEDIFNLDFRVAKEFRLQDVGLTLSADIFNVTDERTVLQRESTLYNDIATPNSSANQIIELQSPRVIRFGARFSF